MIKPASHSVTQRCNRQNTSVGDIVTFLNNKYNGSGAFDALVISGVDSSLDFKGFVISSANRFHCVGTKVDNFNAMFFRIKETSSKKLWHPEQKPEEIYLGNLCERSRTGVAGGRSGRVK
jgi:hypothetical protein